MNDDEILLDLPVAILILVLWGLFGLWVMP